MKFSAKSVFIFLAFLILKSPVLAFQIPSNDTRQSAFQLLVMEPIIVNGVAGLVEVFGLSLKRQLQIRLLLLLKDRNLIFNWH